MDKIIIITLNWNGKDKISKLKQSLLPALSNLEYEWFIKDNGSIDGSVEEIRNWNDIKVNLIPYPNNNQNYSQGMNFLFKEASPKDNNIIITLNNDIIINDPKSIKNMLRILQEDKEVGLVGAKLNYTNTNKIQHCGVLFHKSNGLPYHYRAGVEEKERDRMNRCFPAVTGAVSALRADTFANCFDNKSGLKGFNEKYFFAFEDIDFNLRINHHLKKKIVNCGETNIFHEESASLKKNPVHKLFFNQNCKLFIEAWHKEINVLLEDKYNNPKYAVYRGKE